MNNINDKVIPKTINNANKKFEYPIDVILFQ
jgi:hypothetical protein